MVHLYFPIIVHSSRWNVATLLHPPFGPTWLPTPQKLEKLRSSSRKHCCCTIGGHFFGRSILIFIKLRFSENGTNFLKSLPIYSCQIWWEIFSIFEAFCENLNFSLALVWVICFCVCLLWNQTQKQMIQTIFSGKLKIISRSNFFIIIFTYLK